MFGYDKITGESSAELIDSVLTEYGIDDKVRFMNFTLYALFLVIMISVSLLYILLYVLEIKVTKGCRCCVWFRKYLERSLFYSAWLRYIVEGYLELTLVSLFFTLNSVSFQNLVRGIESSVLLFFLGLMIISPVFILILINRNFTKVKNEDEAFH